MLELLNSSISLSKFYLFIIRIGSTDRHVNPIRQLNYLELRCSKAILVCICFLINCLTSTQSTLGMLSKRLTTRRSQYAPEFVKEFNVINLNSGSRCHFCQYYKNAAIHFQNNRTFLTILISLFFQF